MRKVALMCVATFVGALGITAVASAIQGTQTVSLSLQNKNAGTKAKPRSVGKLTVVTTTTPVAGEPPFATSRAVIHFDKNIVFGSSKFPSCSQSVVQSDPTKCPSGSKVGSGSATAQPSTGGQVLPKIAAYNSSTVYTGNMRASYNSHNWTAKWWTQGEAPSTGGSGVWADNGACGGGTTPPPGGGTSCNYPNWVAGTFYPAGSIVRYTNGGYYRAKNENPGYDPIISTWYWEPYTCNGGGGTTTPPPTGGGSGSFPVSEAQFNQMFPSRIPFYSYAGLLDAIKKYPAFTTTGSDTVRKQEAAAFLANVNHESGGLVYVEEINQANWPLYCDRSQSYGCPAGQSAYHGRGPIQLSWNFNYYAAGNALGLNLLSNPYLVEQDAAVALSL